MSRTLPNGICNLLVGPLWIGLDCPTDAFIRSGSAEDCLLTRLLMLHNSLASDFNVFADVNISIFKICYNIYSHIML